MNCNFCGQINIGRDHHCPYDFKLDAKPERMSSIKFAIYAMIVIGSLTALVAWRVWR